MMKPNAKLDHLPLLLICYFLFLLLQLFIIIIITIATDVELIADVMV